MTGCIICFRNNATEQTETDNEDISWLLLGAHMQIYMKLVGASEVVADGRV